VPQCPADRMESARRFRALLSDLGLQKDQAAQKLHVSLRTLHNWCSGVCEVPYATLKLLRLQRYMELPEPWTGWHFSRGHLITPEGRMIAHHEGAWWSLMVLRARSFDKLAQRIKAIEDAAEGPRLRGGAAAPQMAIAASEVPWDNEACLSNSPPSQTARNIVPPVGNTGGTNPRWLQCGVNLIPSRPSWQLPSGSRPKSNPSQKPTASGSESPSTPSLASHLTPIYNAQSLPLQVPRLRYSLYLNPLPQTLPPALQPFHSNLSDLAPSLGKSLSLPYLQGLSQTQSLSSAPIRPRPNAPSLRTGTGETPSNNVKGVQPC
jgi:hypothetical protein